MGLKIIILLVAETRVLGASYRPST